MFLRSCRAKACYLMNHLCNLMRILHLHESVTFSPFRRFNFLEKELLETMNHQLPSRGASPSPQRQVRRHQEEVVAPTEKRDRKKQLN